MQAQRCILSTLSGPEGLGRHSALMADQPFQHRSALADRDCSPETIFMHPVLPDPRERRGVPAPRLPSPPKAATATAGPILSSLTPVSHTAP